MIELGQKSLSDPELQTLLASLRKKGPYLRQMAYFAALGREDGVTILEAARNESSRGLRHLALSGVAHCCDDDQVESLLPELGPASRQKLIVRLLKAHRRSLVQRWISQLSDPGVELLPYADLATLDKHQQPLRSRGTSADWSRLSRLQPGWCCENALAEDPLWRSKLRVNACLTTLVKYQRPEALTLWKAAIDKGFATIDLPENKLFLAFPQQACEWELPPGPLAGNPRWAYERAAGKLPFEVCEQLLKSGWLTLQYQWWKKHSLESRVAIWNQYRASQIATSGAIGSKWLEKLPFELRAKEALEQSQLGCHLISPSDQIFFLAMLGFEEGKAQLQPLMQNPEVEIRAAGLRGFTRLSKYQPEYLSEILALLATRTNEADPVRAAFLDELANLPSARWQPVHFKPLGEILKALMNAADASNYSMSSAERLVLKILPHQPAWSSAWLGKLLRHWGHVSLSSWEKLLERPGSVEPLDDELSQLVSDWAAKERFFACQQLVGGTSHPNGSLA